MVGQRQAASCGQHCTRVRQGWGGTGILYQVTGSGPGVPIKPDSFRGSRLGRWPWAPSPPLPTFFDCWTWLWSSGSWEMLPGKSNRFRNRYIDHLWQVSATLRTNRRRRGVSRRRECFRTGSLIRSSCLDPEQRPLQGHGHDTSWPLHRPTQRFRLLAWPSCAPVPSWAFSPRRCWVLRASSSSREGAPATQMTQVSQERPVSYIQQRWVGAKWLPISMQSKHPPRPLGQ